MAQIIKYDHDFDNLVAIIEQAKIQAMKAVNAEMIEMYWQIGKYIGWKAVSDGREKMWSRIFQIFLSRPTRLSVDFLPKTFVE